MPLSVGIADTTFLPELPPHDRGLVPYFYHYPRARAYLSRKNSYFAEAFDRYLEAPRGFYPSRRPKI